MEDAAVSDISDWEVLSGASACGGAEEDDDDVVLVSGGGVDVLHDHFALVPAATAASGDGFSGQGRTLVSGESSSYEEDEIVELELLDGFDSISQGSFDLATEASGVQLQLVGVDETREGWVPEAEVPCGATWSAEGRPAEAAFAEENAANSCSKLDLIMQPPHQHHGVGEALDSDATTATGTPPSEVSEDSNLQLEDGGIDTGTEISCLEGVVTSDGTQGEQGEQQQGNDVNAASGCGDELDGEEKDGSLPLVPTSGTNEGEGQVAVWWRLPFRLLHYCAWKVKPVWSFSIAAALLGLAVLGRRMYRMRRKAKGLPQIKIAFDDKRASQFADRAARLNEAFLMARRVPMLRTSSGAVLPWSLVQER